MIECIGEFLLDLAFEASRSHKVPKWIRYPLIAMLSLFFIAVIGLIMVAAYLACKEHILVGIFLFSIGMLLLIMGVTKFDKVY